MFEGERPLGNLIEYLLANGLRRASICDQTLPGVAYLRDRDLVYEKLDFGKGTIEHVPSPYLAGVLDPFIQSADWVPLLETNRGCPFHCTYCVWGIAAMDKVRVFPLERVLEEIEFIASRSPAQRWIFADANFGMLARDVEIAKAVRSVADRYGRLYSSYFWWAKNSSKHTVEIARTLGSLADPLAAVQSLDPVVLKNIKRDNIKLSTMTDLLHQFRETGLKTTTDVLLGLPGESKERHLSTLRQTFDLNFDHIDVGNIRLLPGSEMESDATRSEYELHTRYRLISGSYGRYDGVPVLEFEESVRGSKDITEPEMHSLRLIHFLVWALWNLGVAKPLLFWHQAVHGRNPVDVILSLIEADETSALGQFIEGFMQEALAEWFDTPADLERHYRENFEELIEHGFLKMNFKYLAKLLLDPGLTETLLRGVAGEDDSPILQELRRFCQDRVYYVNAGVQHKQIDYSAEAVQFIESSYPGLRAQSTKCAFDIQPKTKSAIDFDLDRFGFARDPERALALTLESYRSQFLYDFTFGVDSPVESVGDLSGSFDYHAQLGPRSDNI